jgi:acyl-CoA thioester hydrolase
MSTIALSPESIPYPLRAMIRVRTYELDSFGHVNNAVYLNYMEEARSEYLKQMGLSFHDFAQLGVQIVIAESYVKYLVPARYGDTVAVYGRIQEVRPASATFHYRLVRAESNDILAEGWTRGVFVNAATGRPTRAPKEFADAFHQMARE